jgi:hypothetical protein
MHTARLMQWAHTAAFSRKEWNRSWDVDPSILNGIDPEGIGAVVPCIEPNASLASPCIE